MSFDGVLPDEMDGPIRDDDGFDPLDGTEGAVGAGDHTLFVEDLRTAFPETPLPQRVAEDHIAAMVGAIQLLADKGGSALEPTSKAHGPDRRVSGLPKLRRRTMPKRLIVKLAAAMAMLLSLAGLANAGMLPDPIQRPIASVLGFDTDDADDEGEDGDDQGEDGDVDGDEAEHGGLVGGDPDEADDDADDEGDDDADEDGDEGDEGDDADDEDGDEGDDADDEADEDGDEADGGDEADEDGDEDGGDDSQ